MAVLRIGGDLIDDHWYALTPAQEAEAAARVRALCEALLREAEVVRIDWSNPYGGHEGVPRRTRGRRRV